MALSRIKQNGIHNDLQLRRILKRSIEDLTGLRQHGFAIHARVHTSLDRREEIQVEISLLPSFSSSNSSPATGQILNTIASEVRKRATELPVSKVISFSTKVTLHGESIGLRRWLTTPQKSTKKVTILTGVAAEPGIEILRTLEIEQGIGQGFKGAEG
jgi:hypothetical protein